MPVIGGSGGRGGGGGGPPRRLTAFNKRNFTSETRAASFEPIGPSVETSR